MSGFSIPLDKLAAKAMLDIETVVRKSTFELFNAVIEKSPVDTGRFRANWSCSQGKYSSEKFDSTEKSRATEQAKLALNFETGGIVYFTNSLPYAYRLEYEGWSNQAPQGMVRVSIEEYATFVREALK
ncbi:MAG: HK97 gp10 family phage protein [Casimicrobium sp.]